MLTPTVTNSRSAMTVKSSSERFLGSTKETYWFLHGKPTKGKGKRNDGCAQAHISKVVPVEADSKGESRVATLTHEEVVFLQQV